MTEGAGTPHEGFQSFSRDETQARILLSFRGTQAGAAVAPAFPWVQYHTAGVAYEEALIDGCYRTVNWSAMGRPASRERLAQSGPQQQVVGGRHATWSDHAFDLQVDGQRLVSHWQWVDAREVEAGSGLAFEVELMHAVRPIRVVVRTELDGTAFFVRRLEITNTGDRPAAIGAIFPWSGLIWSTYLRSATWPLGAAAPFSLGRFQTTTALYEGQFAWETLPAGSGLHLEHLQGLSGQGTPFFIVRNDIGGEMVVGQLEYSGNWQMEFFNDHEPVVWPLTGPNLYARVGLAGDAPLRVLAPGESISTPAVHLGHMYGDLDTCVQELHTHLRRSLIPVEPPDRAQLVECNHTGYTWNAPITEEQLFQEIDLAADVGVELFMVDAGWFGDESDTWARQVGDWEETPLLRHGLAAIFERVRSRGMKCGLWAEVERATSVSKTGAAHPDWLMRRNGRVIEQLDLARPEVARHVEETIVRLVTRYGLDCFRLDYNIRIGLGGEEERDGYLESTMWRYYDALYGVFDRVHAQFPDLLLENCAGGGGRWDTGMMRRFHWTQITDNWSPVPTLKMVNGATLALPPEQCMTLLGAIALGTADLDFMLRIGLFGHFCVSGIFPVMEQRHLASRERWRHAVHLYKTVARPILTTCRVFHHTLLQRHDEPGEWCVLEFAAPDGASAYAGIFRLAGAATGEYHFRPRGLTPGQRYRVILDNTGHQYERAGHELIEEGLHVRVPGVLQSELLVFQALGM